MKMPTLSALPALPALPRLPKRSPKADRPKADRVKRVRPPKPLSAYRLARGALGDLRQGWKRYFWLAAVIGVPYSLIGLSDSLNRNLAVGAYGYVAILIMNVALMWAALQHEATGEVPKA